MMFQSEKREADLLGGTVAALALMLTLAFGLVVDYGVPARAAALKAEQQAYAMGTGIPACFENRG